jgi:hypothetical protein
MTEWALFNVTATKWHALTGCNMWHMQPTVEHIITVYHNLSLKVSIGFQALLITWRVSVRLPTTNFHATLYYGRFWKSVWQVKIWLKSDKNVGHLTWKLGTFFFTGAMNSAYYRCFRVRGIRLLGQGKKCKQFKIFCTSWTILRKCIVGFLWQQGYANLPHKIAVIFRISVLKFCENGPCFLSLGT